MQSKLKSTIKALLIRANTVLDESVFNCLCNLKDESKKSLIISNCKIAKETGRPLCQDTGQVLVFLKLPFDFSFGFGYKKVINDAVEEAYSENFYRKSVVKNAVFERVNTNTNAPAIIYTDFENRESVRIDVLIKGGGAENMSFVEMFNPTASQDEIVSKISKKIAENAKNACPPLFIGIGIGGTMDYAAVLSKKALFEGCENEFCEMVKEEVNTPLTPTPSPQRGEGKTIIDTPLNPSQCLFFADKRTSLLSQDSCIPAKIRSPQRGEGKTAFDKPLTPNHSDSMDKNEIVVSVKMLSTSTHIASLPVAVTINCHSNRHAGCEIGKNEIIYDWKNYEISDINADFKEYKTFNYPKDADKGIKPGDKILFSGTLYTMRDAAHKRIEDMLREGKKLPFEIKNSVIFYAGPAPKKGNEVVGPIGPTTAKRMDKFAPRLYDFGCFATIGKGERSNEVKEACKRNKAHYFSAQGGIACLLQQSFKTAELIAFEDLGTEAIYKFEVENLPLTVVY